jgi:hypothetical protein
MPYQSARSIMKGDLNIIGPDRETVATVYIPDPALIISAL